MLKHIKFCRLLYYLIPATGKPVINWRMSIKIEIYLITSSSPYIYSVLYSPFLIHVIPLRRSLEKRLRSLYSNCILFILSNLKYIDIVYCFHTIRSVYKRYSYVVSLPYTFPIAIVWVCKIYLIGTLLSHQIFWWNVWYVDHLKSITIIKYFYLFLQTSRLAVVLCALSMKY